jgi:hypothetical protein
MTGGGRGCGAAGRGRARRVGAGSGAGRAAARRGGAGVQAARGPQTLRCGRRRPCRPESSACVRGRVRPGFGPGSARVRPTPGVEDALAAGFAGGAQVEGALRRGRPRSRERAGTRFLSSSWRGRRRRGRRARPRPRPRPRSGRAVPGPGRPAPTGSTPTTAPSRERPAPSRRRRAPRGATSFPDGPSSRARPSSARRVSAAEAPSRPAGRSFRLLPPSGAKDVCALRPRSARAASASASATCSTRRREEAAPPDEIPVGGRAFASASRPLREAGSTPAGAGPPNRAPRGAVSNPGAGSATGRGPAEPV